MTRRISLARHSCKVLVLLFYIGNLFSAQGIESKFRGRLESKKLRAAVLDAPPFSIITETRDGPEYEGFAVDAFLQLEKKLGFAHEFKKYPKGERYFAEEMNKCISDDGSTENCEYDIGVGGFIVNSEKLAFERIAFVEPFTESQTFKMITRAEQSMTRRDYLLLFKPFSWWTWLMLVGLWVLTILSLYLLYLWLEKGETSAWSPDNSLEALGLSVSSLFGCSYHHHTLSLPFLYSARSICLIMAVIMCFVFISYESSVTSLKSLELGRTSRYRSIEDVRLCRVPLNRIIVESGSAAKDYLIRNVEGRCDENQGKFQICTRGYEECIKAVLNNTADFSFTTSGVIDYYVKGRYCGDVAIVGEPFMPQRVGFILPRTNNSNPSVLKMFNLATLRLQEEGTLSTLEAKMPSCSYLKTEEVIFGSELLLPFAVGAVLFTLFVIVASINIFHRRLKSKEKLTTPVTLSSASISSGAISV